ncbi:MAG: hypothetical protein ACTSW1_14690 [Candidatus Hodarchaeales archaeon]
MKSKKKMVQTSLSLEEHEILKNYASRHEISIKEAVRRAIIDLLKNETIYKDDPYFNIKVSSSIDTDKASQEVDSLIYNNETINE